MCDDGSGMPDDGPREGRKGGAGRANEAAAGPRSTSGGPPGQAQYGGHAQSQPSAGAPHGGHRPDAGPPPGQAPWAPPSPGAAAGPTQWQVPPPHPYPGYGAWQAPTYPGGAGPAQAQAAWWGAPGGMPPSPAGGYYPHQAPPGYPMPPLGIGHGPHGGAGMSQLMQEIAGGGSGLASLSQMLNLDDKELWKGALIGAAAVLLLTNESVQNALFKTGVQARDAVRSGVDRVKSTAAGVSAGVAKASKSATGEADD